MYFVSFPKPFNNKQINLMRSVEEERFDNLCNMLSGQGWTRLKDSKQYDDETNHILLKSCQ